MDFSVWRPRSGHNTPYYGTRKSVVASCRRWWSVSIQTVCASHRQILVCIVADSSRSLCVVRASWQKFSTPDLVTEIWVLEISFSFSSFYFGKNFWFWGILGTRFSAEFCRARISAKLSSFAAISTQESLVLCGVQDFVFYEDSGKPVRSLRGRQRRSIKSRGWIRLEVVVSPLLQGEGRPAGSFVLSIAQYINTRRTCLQE